MNRRTFTREQIKKISKNKNVNRCSTKSVMYTKSFKIKALRQYNYFDPAKYYIITTNNLKLSGEASLHFIMKNRLRTCGSLSFVAVVLLKKLGFQSRLVGGKRKASGRWVHHAWIEVKLKNRWQPFDLFAKNFKLSPKKSRKIKTCRSWKELNY